MTFEIGEDYDFYCYLKHNLSKNYKIFSEPLTDYYSEWYFNYVIEHNGKIVEKIKGDFRKIKTGELVDLAKDIIKKYNRDNYANR